MLPSTLEELISGDTSADKPTHWLQMRNPVRWQGMKLPFKNEQAVKPRNTGVLRRDMCMKYMNVYEHVGCMCTCGHIWRLEANARCLPLLLSTYRRRSSPTDRPQLGHSHPGVTKVVSAIILG